MNKRKKYKPQINVEARGIAAIAETVSAGLATMKIKFRQQRKRVEQLIEETRKAAKNEPSDIGACAEIETALLAFLEVIDDILITLDSCS